jgi:hypothetical protein
MQLDLQCTAATINTEMLLIVFCFVVVVFGVVVVVFITNDGYQMC